MKVERSALDLFERWFCLLFVGGDGLKVAASLIEVESFDLVGKTLCLKRKLFRKLP